MRATSPKEASSAVQDAAPLAWLSVILSLGLVAAPCGDDDDDRRAVATPMVSRRRRDQHLRVVDRRADLVAAAEAFQTENSDVKSRSTVPAPATASSCSARARPTSPTPPGRSTRRRPPPRAEAGIEYTELKVAYDGITVMTTPTTARSSASSFADLYALIGPECEGFANWSDAQAIATDLGSTTLPDADLELTGPGAESGTYDSFVELALGDATEARGQEEGTTAPTTRPRPTTTRSSPTSRSRDLARLGRLRLRRGGRRRRQGDPGGEEPGGDCVEPSAETISDDGYPLSRSLFIYVNKAKASDNAALSRVRDFYLENLTEFVEVAAT